MINMVIHCPPGGANKDGSCPGGGLSHKCKCRVHIQRILSQAQILHALRTWQFSATAKAKPSHCVQNVLTDLVQKITGKSHYFCFVLNSCTFSRVGF